MALSGKRVLTEDPLTGLVTYHQYDEDTDETVLSYEADAEPVLERNKILQNDPEHWKKGVKNDFVFYASIPVGVQMKWLVEKGVDVWKHEHGRSVSKLLEDPEYRHLKCTTKTHIIKG